ncbi:MAG: TlpA disulfide reductase family protein [Chitinophagaceae bacterium]
MKFYTIILVAFLSMAAGGKKEMKINGTYLRTPKAGEKIYLAITLDAKKRTKQLLDSVNVKDNHFSFNLKKKQPGKYEIVNTAGQSFSVYLDYCQTNIVIDSMFMRAKITGNITDSLIKKFDGIQTGIALTQLGVGLMSKKYKDEGKEMPDSLVKQFVTSLDRLTASRKEYSKSIGSRNDFAAAYVLATGASSEFTIPELNAIYKKMDGYVKTSQYGVNFKTLLDKMNNLEVGVKAPAFAQPNTEGANVDFASFVKGKKLVMIDFWASWCGPCRKENPNVVALYNEYKAKGFEIIGVSLDDKKDAWLKAIADDKLTWTHVSDLGGWANSVAKLYNVSAVPQTFLVDGNGVIIARNLRGKDLDDKVKEICN